MTGESLAMAREIVDAVLEVVRARGSISGSDRDRFLLIADIVDREGRTAKRTNAHEHITGIIARALTQARASATRQERERAAGIAAEVFRASVRATEASIAAAILADNTPAAILAEPEDRG